MQTAATRTLSFTLGLLLAAAHAAAADSTYAWRTTVTTNWSEKSVWVRTSGPGNVSGYPDAAGDHAVKDQNVGNTTIILDLPAVTLGRLGKSHASDNNTTTIALPADAATNTIFLRASSGSARVYCRYGTLTVQPDLVLASPTLIGADGNDNNGNNMNIDGAVRGVGDLTVNGNTAGSGRKVAIAGLVDIEGSVTARGASDRFNGGIGPRVNKLLVNMTGTCQLAAPCSYTGDTQIVAGTLQLNSPDTLPHGDGKGNVDAYGTLNLNGKTTTINGLSGTGRVGTGATVSLRVGDRDASSLFGGVLYDGGSGKTLTLVKIGAGTLTLTNQSTYAGATVVSNGTLVVDGVITNTSGFTVAAGAILSGSGTIRDVSVSGVLAPGHGVGTLRIAGSVNLLAGSTLALERTAGTADRIEATGSLALGGCLQAAAAPSGSWLIATAAGGVTGAFDSLPAGMRLRREHADTELWLDVAPTGTLLLVR